MGEVSVMASQENDIMFRKRTAIVVESFSKPVFVAHYDPYDPHQSSLVTAVTYPPNARVNPGTLLFFWLTQQALSCCVSFPRMMKFIS